MISAAASCAGSVVTVSRDAARSSSPENLPRRIDMAAVVLHFFGAEVKSDSPQLLAECHRERQTNVTESDDSNCAHDSRLFLSAMLQFSLKISILGAAGTSQLAILRSVASARDQG